jgi:hypothetical protein
VCSNGPRLSPDSTGVAFHSYGVVESRIPLLRGCGMDWLGFYFPNPRRSNYDCFFSRSTAPEQIQFADAQEPALSVAKGQLVENPPCFILWREPLVRRAWNESTYCYSRLSFYRMGFHYRHLLFYEDAMVRPTVIGEEVDGNRIPSATGDLVSSILLIGAQS